MPTEAPTLSPKTPLSDPTRPEYAVEPYPSDAPESKEHDFVFADPNSRFAREFGPAYQEHLAQVRTGSRSIAERTSNGYPTPRIGELLDIANIREQVNALADPATRATTAPASTTETTIPAQRIEQLPLQTVARHARIEPIKNALTSTRERAAGLAYAYLGNKTPKFVKKHVPVYRAVSKENAGYGNQWGVSEWTIGAGKEPKRHATDWVRNNTYNPADPETHHLQGGAEYIAIKSTLGELEASGRAEVRHYGDYGSARKKVVLRHADPQQPVRHKVISSNKGKASK